MQDVALRYEPVVAPQPEAAPEQCSVPPPAVAAVLLANSARWQLRQESTCMPITLRGLSLFLAEADGALEEHSLTREL